MRWIDGSRKPNPFVRHVKSYWANISMRPLLMFIHSIGQRRTSRQSRPTWAYYELKTSHAIDGSCFNGQEMDACYHSACARVIGTRSPLVMEYSNGFLKFSSTKYIQTWTRQHKFLWAESLMKDERAATLYVERWGWDSRVFGTSRKGDQPLSRCDKCVLNDLTIDLFLSGCVCETGHLCIGTTH